MPFNAATMVQTFFAAPVSVWPSVGTDTGRDDRTGRDPEITHQSKQVFIHGATVSTLSGVPSRGADIAR